MSVHSEEHPFFPQTFSAKHQGIINCQVCSGLSLDTETHCADCGSAIHMRKPKSLERTIALLITAIILYIPANIFPIMMTESLKGSSAKSIMGGVILFMEHGDYFIAAVIFIASVIIPLVKMMALSWLCLCAVSARWSQPLRNTQLFRMVEVLGRWSMVDVFVVAILVGLVQFDNILTITPGTAALSFAGVVAVSMLAAMAFDTRLIWDTWDKQGQFNG